MFNKKNRLNDDLNALEAKEIEEFYKMLLKMKKKRPNFNVIRVMQMLYGEKFNEKEVKE